MYVYFQEEASSPQMAEDSGDVGVEEALPGEEGAAWGGEEAEEGSEQGRKFWWSHTDMKVCF